LQEQENAQTRYSILVVDPDSEFADMVAQAISDAQGMYKVSVETNARQAIAQVREAQAAQHLFDLLIADVRTPGSDSMQMIEELAQAYPGLKIVTMTAYHSPELATQVQQLNVYTHLVKPVAPSQFRQLVQSALTGKSPVTGPAFPPTPLSQTQQAAVERQLANLRRMTSSTAALLVHANGAIRAIDCLEEGLDANVLGSALMDAQRGVAQALAQALQGQDPIRQSYFGTASYSICVYRLDDAHAVATIFGPEVREGQMWYAMREGTGTLQEALAAGETEPPEQRSSGQNDGFAMVERYFAQQETAQTRPRHSPRGRSLSTQAQGTAPRAQDTTTETTMLQMPSPAESAGDQAQPPSDQDLALPSIAAPLEMERLNIDEIDWELQGPQDWDSLAADTGQSFLGMSFEEAKQRGLLDNLDADRQSP